MICILNQHSNRGTKYETSSTTKGARAYALFGIPHRLVPAASCGEFLGEKNQRYHFVARKSVTFYILWRIKMCFFTFCRA